MPDEKKDPNEATTHADLYHRHEQRTENWEEAEAVTDRPNDTPLRGEDDPAVPNSTLASRAAAAKKANAKQVSKDEDEVEDKKVSRASTKRAKKSS